MRRSRSEMALRVVAAVAGSVAVFCLFVSAMVALEAAGAMPAWLYPWSLDSSLSVRKRAWDLPVEYVLAWLMAVPAILIGRYSASRPGSAFVSFVISAPTAGYAAYLAKGAGWDCLTYDAALTAAAIVTVTTMVLPWPRPRQLLDQWIHAIRVSHPIRRLAWSLGFFVLVSQTFWVRQTIASITATESSRRNLVRWYTAQVDPQASGPVHVEVFTDYECPYSSSQVPEAGALVGQMAVRTGMKVTLSERDFPIDSLCNLRFSRAVHPSACDAAAARRLIIRELGQDAGDEFAAWLYSHRGKVAPDAVRAMLAVYGLADSFRTERNELLRIVALDAAAGSQLGVSATPTFFVDGVRLPGGLDSLKSVLTFRAGLKSVATATAMEQERR